MILKKHTFLFATCVLATTSILLAGCGEKEENSNQEELLERNIIAEDVSSNPAPSEYLTIEKPAK